MEKAIIINQEQKTILKFVNVGKQKLWQWWWSFSRAINTQILKEKFVGKFGYKSAKRGKVA